MRSAATSEYAIAPGELRSLIQIQSQSSTPDDFGQSLETWTTVLTAWASIKAVTLSEAFQPNQFTSQVTHIIKMRWTAVPISGGMRAVYGTHIYKIQAPENVDERNLVLKLRALEINGTA